ncbi:hypothetical protein EDC04DRAFT_2958761 [Pisolithus marmoratus]|nr:hypothetical protein EDC04DRAFT_2958761 [Pisolithus marmoratus]
MALTIQTSGDRINLSNPTPEELDNLSNACKPASFGVNREQVYDETARNAGLIDVVRRELLTATDAKREIKVEIYKLNVYGKGSFFKAHKDTPRDETMFGSLVIIFPTPHEGGEFVLREKGREWSLDFAKMLSATSQTPCVGYVSFFSDVEHEVHMVASGYRVTLTYNLYFVHETQGTIGTTSAPAPYEGSLAAPLYALLTDPAVLPRGGYLAFGLRRHYPVQRGTRVIGYDDCLKGTDAALGRVLTSLGVAWNVLVFYRNVGSYNDYIDDVIDDLSGECHEIYDFNKAMGESAELVEFSSIDGIARVRRHPHANPPLRQFAKATRVDSMTFSRSPYVMSGYYRAEVGELYGEVCIVADLQEPAQRVVRKVDIVDISTETETGRTRRFVFNAIKER